MKFKVGDEVRALCDSLHKGIKKGETGIVKEVDYECSDNRRRICVVSNDEWKNGLFLAEELELSEPKPTKNQRITALEKEVAELKVIVHELRGNKNILNANFEKGVKWVEKTANELRAEIIEKAKVFVESDEYKDPYGEYRVRTAEVGTVCCKVEFVVNERKRTVLALLKGVATKKVRARGIAKCNPSDVFNSHIGKAIALGRALNLDVSEFEQAVQPTKIVEGTEILFVYSLDTHVMEEKYVERANDELGKGYVKIINDTNAIYGGVE